MRTWRGSSESGEDVDGSNGWVIEGLIRRYLRVEVVVVGRFMRTLNLVPT